MIFAGTHLGRTRDVACVPIVALTDESRTLRGRTGTQMPLVFLSLCTGKNRAKEKDREICVPSVPPSQVVDANEPIQGRTLRPTAVPSVRDFTALSDGQFVSRFRFENTRSE